MKRLLIISFISSLLLASCGKDDITGMTYPEGTLLFGSTGIETVGTKATASPIAEGRTVRVVVYTSENGATAPDLAGREYIMTNTYEVLADGSLKPCKVDAQGNKIAGEAFDIQVPVYGADIKYLDLFAYSPALPLNADNKSVTVTNGIDFIETAMYGKGIVYSPNAPQVVNFDPMKRLCSSLLFEYIHNSGNIDMLLRSGEDPITDRKLGFLIKNIYASGVYTLGNSDITMPTDNVVSKYYAPDGFLTNPVISTVLTKTKLYGELFLLPGAANNTVANGRFRFEIDINFKSGDFEANATATSYPWSSNSQVLVKGVRTKFNMSASVLTPSTYEIIFWTAGEIVPWTIGTPLNIVI